MRLISEEIQYIIMKFHLAFNLYYSLILNIKKCLVGAHRNGFVKGIV